VDGTVRRVEGSEARSEQGSGGAEAQGSIDRVVASRRRRGTASWGDEGSEAEESGVDGRSAARSVEGVGEAVPRGAVETAPEALAGIQATTPPGVRVGETRSNRPSVSTAGLTSIDDRKGAEAAPGGVRDPDEEQGSAGKNPRDGCGMKQGREARVR
jgi:hypothetical protein